MHSVNRSQKKVLDPLEQELWSCLVLRTEPGPLQEHSVFLNAKASLKTRTQLSYFMCAHTCPNFVEVRTVPFPHLCVWVARLVWPVPYLITASFIQSERGWVLRTQTVTQQYNNR